MVQPPSEPVQGAENAKSMQNQQKAIGNLSEVDHHEERRTVAAAAFVFAGGTFASRLLGLVRDRMTAMYFPIEVRDAFTVAFRLPNLFRRLLGEGALSVSFIPVFVDLISRERTQKTEQGSLGQNEAAARLVGSVFTLLLSVTITLSLLGIIWMPEVLGFLLSGEGYMNVPGKFELTVKLSRVMFSFLIFITMYAFFMAILNSLKRFALTALAPAFFNIAMISAALISPQMAAPESVLAWSVILGGLLQMGILIPSIVKAGYWPMMRLRWEIDGKSVYFWKVPEMQRVLRAIVPSLFGMGVLQITTLLNVRFAAELPQGSHSYLYLADRILELPLALFAVSVGSALLPTLSAQWARKDRHAMTETILHALQLIGFVAIPAAIGMYMLAQPITEVLFLGREFKYQDALATAQIIQVYAFGLLISACVRILVQGFYSVGNTWYPALAGCIALVAHLVFAWAGTRAFGLPGLAGASVASASVNLIMLMIAYQKWIGNLRWLHLAKRLAAFLGAGVVLAAGCSIYDPLVIQFGSRFVTRTLALFVAIGFGSVLYLFVSWIFKFEEYQETMARLLGRLKAKLKKRVRQS